MDFLTIVKDGCRFGIFVAVAVGSVIAHAQDAGGQRPGDACKVPYTATQWSTSSTTLPDGSVKVITGQTDLAQSSAGQLRMVAHAWSDGAERKIQPITQIHIQDWKNHNFIMLFPDVHLASQTPMPAVSSTSQASLPKPMPLPKFIKTDLGSKTIRGIPVTGERNVYTSMESSGADGSLHEVTHTSETWYNAKMCLTMEVTTHDSNNGTGHNETTYVDTAEPDAALFEIPTGYTLSKP